MRPQAQKRSWLAGTGHAHGELTSMERYRRSQRLASDGGPRAADRPHPLEFDESGFPIPQRSPTFIDRVARLLRSG